MDVLFSWRETEYKLDQTSRVRGDEGETEKEKGPGDLFPVEPTDEAAMLRGEFESPSRYFTVIVGF